MSINFPRNALLTIYKSFIRPHLDYGDISYDNPNNENFQSKLEKVQYRASLAITGAIKATSRERIYNELGLHSLSTRRWRSKLIFLYKIVNSLLPECPNISVSFYYKIYSIKNKSFKKIFFPYCINEWNNLNVEIRNVRSFNIFENSILSEKKETSLFSVHVPLGLHQPRLA